MLEAAVAAGLASAGVDVLLLGVLPTPAVAFLTDDFGADLGVVISASHNAMPDNGIKIFAAGGLKLDDAVEDAIETADGRPRLRCPPARGSAGSGTAVDADRRYLDHLLVATPNPLDGLQVVVDCAHGAASELAPEVYRRAGAEVVVIGGSPDGLNINAGVGSTYLAGLRDAVIAERRRPGHRPRRRRRPLPGGRRGRLGRGRRRHPGAAGDRRCGTAAGWSDDTVVATVMANIGFHQAMAKAGHHGADHRGR